MKPAAMNKPPNILLITSDQQRGDCYGFEGRKVKTPHLDEMARTGTRFSSCITPNVVCQPSRASILTGLLPNTHGVWDNGVDLDYAVGERGFAGQFARAGYKTAMIGKAHFSTYHTFKATGRPECRKSGQNYPADWQGPYMGFEHLDLMVGGHNNQLPQHPPQGLQYERWYHRDGRGEEKNRLYGMHLPPDVGAAQTFHSALPTAWHNSTWCGDRTINFMRNHREQPFIAWTSFPDPHHPFDAPDPWSRMHHPDEVDLPPFRELDFERRPWWHKASFEGVPQLEDPALRYLRTNYSRVPAQTDEQLRHMIANYYGMISLIDHNVGRILIALDDLGLADNTIVVYSTDHGDWLGDHGIILKGPIMYEGLLRVGCIVKGPGIPHGKIVADPVATNDLPATFYDWCGVSAGGPIHGQSLKGLIEGDRDSRDFAYNEWDLHASRCGVGLRLRTVRTKTCKLTLELDSGAGEMYDLEEDPYEMENLFGDEAHRAMQREMTDMIASRPDDAMSPRPEPVGLG